MSALSVVQFSVCMKTEIDTFSSVINVLVGAMYFIVYTLTLTETCILPESLMCRLVDSAQQCMR